ncbi:MAG TPA: ABC transporter permease [Phycisphaerae bacterium]|nr:ABC transporter permease [Phycisphaerae bacterium]HNU44258.1 ABC transporter permease [Phycisphaerae bacterium]
MSVLLQDLRYAMRMLVKQPAVTAVIVLTLTFGIGVNTAVFSVVHGVLLRPLPYPDANDLVALRGHFPGRGTHDESLSPGLYFEVRDQSDVFADVALVKSHSLTLTGAGLPERVRGVCASASCLPMLGARPTLGRISASGDDEPGSPRTIVLSHGLWERRFGSDPDVIDRVIRLDEQDYTIIGVLDGTFPATRTYLPMLHDHSARIDYWIPLALSGADRQDHGRQNYELIARLKQGVDVAVAQKKMSLLAGRLRQELPRYYPPDSGFTLEVVPLLEPAVQGVRPALRLLTGAAALVLLVACANVANLLLARAAGRRQEIAMRAALGASRARILGQLLTESVLLSLLGGALGLLLAWWGTSALLAVGAQTVPRIGEVTIDMPVAMFTLGLSLLTGIVFGLAPAGSALRVGLQETIRADRQMAIGAGFLGRRRYRARGVLVVAEQSLCVILLIGAGLLLHSFYRLQRVDLGFSPEGVLSFQLPANCGYQKNMAAYRTFYADLRQRLAGLPGVESVGGMSMLPLTSGESFAPVAVEDYVAQPDEPELQANSCTALGACFETLRIPLRAGRYFDERDTADSLPVAIVDEAFAQRVWPGADPLGKRIQDPLLGARSPWATVVGVVATVRWSALAGDSRITYYRPYTQWPCQSMYVMVRTSCPPHELTSAVGSAVSALDARWPVMQMATMEQRLATILAPRRFALCILGVFAAAALVLAAGGLYAVLAHLVAQSTHEIGIRMALGARQSQIRGSVLRQGLALTAIGVAIGLIVALAGARVLAALLYEVSVADPVTFIGVPVLLAAVSLSACYLPARRATRIDPITALRCE